MHHANGRDVLLAAIFLLAWFEVVRDQVFDQRLFPGELAGQIITSEGSRNRYSKQLLQWFSILDSKASHLGGQHLLSQKSLQVVSEHHTQINSEESSDELLCHLGTKTNQRSHPTMTTPRPTRHRHAKITQPQHPTSQITASKSRLPDRLRRSC